MFGDDDGVYERGLHKTPFTLLGKPHPELNKFNTIFDEKTPQFSPIVKKHVKNVSLLLPTLPIREVEPEILFIPPKTPRGTPIVPKHDDEFDQLVKGN